MDNMNSFWQLADELRGFSRISEEQQWLMAASKLADQTRNKVQRINNLDLSMDRARVRRLQEDNSSQNLNFGMLDLDSVITENVGNAVYRKSSVIPVGNVDVCKYSGYNLTMESNNKDNITNVEDANLTNANDRRFKTLPASEVLPRDEVLGGYIFVCNNDTMQEDLKRQLFALPSRYRDSVRAIMPGLPLFLYNYTTHQLHGIFEAASFGGTNIDPTAWEDKKCKGESRFPAQVRINIRKVCKALSEDAFRPVLHHYDGPKFRLELSIPETLAILDLCEQAVAP